MIVKVQWTSDGKEYVIGVNKLMELLGLKVTEEQIKTAVKKAVQTQ